MATTVNPVDTSSFTPQQLAAFNTANALGSGVQTYNSTQTATPVGQTVANPAPQIQTPTAPAAQNPVTTGTPQLATTTQPATNTTGLTYNGSVVDLLNAAGQDSSYAARAQLAQQYGIQGYTGSASQNQELAQKYLAAYNQAKGGAIPQNGADARTALNTSLDTQGNNQTIGTPAQQFVDLYSSMNPVEANIFQQLSGLLSTQNTQQSLTDLYTQLNQQQGIPDLQIQLADVNKIMSGTEDDIRAEITNAGGFATESQVQAMTTARNKTLLNQANYLQNVLNSKEDYVNQIVSLTQADRDETSKELDQKLGIAQTLVTMSDNMENAARSNYEQIVSQSGYSGLAKALQNNPEQMSNAERLLGLGQGSLSDSGFLSSMDTGQVLGSSANGYFTYNPYTGETTPITGGTSKPSSAPNSGSQPTTSNETVPTLNGKPLTDAQATTLGYVQRLSDADTTISKLGSVGTSGVESVLSSIPFGVGNYLTSSDYQQLQQAERNFINAVLRRESGASISPSEFDSAAKQYFPQPGDSSAVIQQKTANRQTVINSLSQVANVPTSYVNQNKNSTGSYQDYLNAIGE